MVRRQTIFSWSAHCFFFFEEVKKRLEKVIACIDAAHRHSPRHCTEYAEEIFAYLRKTERLRMPSPNYLETVQDSIKPFMRTKLLNWVVEVVESFQMSQETLYLSQNFVWRNPLASIFLCLVD